MSDRPDPERPGRAVSRRRLLQSATGLAAGLAGCSVNWLHRAGGGAVTVRSTAGLHAAFDGLSAGDTLYVSAENAPYRTTQWLDVDVDDVAIVGPGLSDLVKPADGADVGGIRIGHHDPCENVFVGGIGFHGNREHQRPNAPRRHGIAVRDAANVTLAGNHVRRTGPLRHGDGGSGISVTHHASDVRITGNVVEEWGDRGIQLSGRRLLVTGNRLEGGLDRAVSCDLWYPRGENYTARHVLVAGNVMGDCREGSLTGVANNSPVDEPQGNVAVVGNVGFGAHKSFCHVRGPGPVRNVTVQQNTSVQETAGLDTEATTAFAGVAIDAEAGRNLTVRNNAFYGYSGPGVNVDGEIRDLTVQGNTLSRPAGAGVRVAQAEHARVTGNDVVEPGTVGILLADATEVVVRDNRVRGAGDAGIDVRGTGDTGRHDVSANVVADAGLTGGAPAIRVCDDGVRVRGNTLRRHRGPAVAECPDAAANCYEANYADGDDPWAVTSPDARLRNNTPPVDVHRGLTADPDRGVVEVQFDRPYARPPRLTFGRTAGAVNETSYLTDPEGDFVGVEISVAERGTFDVFVDDR